MRPSCIRYSNQKKENAEEIDFEKPVKFSTSPAASWKAEASFTGRADADITPWYQPYVVSLSVAAFMIYFCILREESDIDHELDVPLFDRVQGLEEIQLVNIIRYYETNDPKFDVKPFETRLAEVRALKAVEKLH